MKATIEIYPGIDVKFVLKENGKSDLWVFYRGKRLPTEVEDVISGLYQHVKRNDEKIDWWKTMAIIGFIGSVASIILIFYLLKL